MEPRTIKLVMAIGVLLNSALYLAGCIAAALVLGDVWAVRLALAAAGVTYLSYMSQYQEGNSPYTISLVRVSVGLGVLAGVGILCG